jgi:hypothetical protein
MQCRFGHVPSFVRSLLAVLAVLPALLATTISLPDVQVARAQADPAPSAPAAPAAPATTDIASYELDVRWEPAARQIHGSGTIIFRNASSDVLDRLWLKLYLNAFSSEQTTWMREASGVHRGSDYDPRQPGWIRLEQLRLADTGENLLPPAIASDTTSLQVPLPTARAIQPGETVRIEMRWISQLPRVFARTGVAGDFVMAGQWYPKLAVYDRGAWDTEPWHANAEFFADFGAYALTLTVPPGYVTGASGTRASIATNPDGTTTTRYLAEPVTDIAWTAWPDYRMSTTVVEAAGRPVELELLLPRSLPPSVDHRYFTSAHYSLDLLGQWYGPYPWPKLTLVVPPANADGAGGMEYPSLVTLGLPEPLPFGLSAGVRLVEVVTVHEIAHQWIPLQVATNEAREAWLDEGFADYATIRVLEQVYGADRSLIDLGPFHIGYEALHRSQFQIAGVREQLVRPSWEYDNFLAYGVTVYSKGALFLRTLERTLGEERFTSAMRQYVERWRWRHPTTADFQRSLESELDISLDYLFQPLAYGSGVVEYGLVDVSAGGATVARRGDAIIPVEVAWSYRDGRTERLTWDAEISQLRLEAPDRDLASVQIDPDWQLRLEPDRLDNGREISPSPVPLLAVAARLLSVLQTILLAGTLG